jgi:hypothetical protein
MMRRVGLGAAVGAIVTSMSWAGNESAHTVSTFPDGVTFLALFFLVAAAVRLDLHWGGLAPPAAILPPAIVISTVAGTVLGAGVAAFGAIRLAAPTAGLLAFVFLSAVIASVACGALAAAGWSFWLRLREA